MQGLTDKIILFFVCILNLTLCASGLGAVAAVLSVFTACSLATAFTNRKAHIMLTAAYFALCLFYPPAVIMSAPFVYCCFDREDLKKLICFIPFLPVGFYMGVRAGILTAACSLLACQLAFRQQMLEEKQRQLILTRDTGVEKSMLLSERNRHLIQKQNAEIQMATLKERNRIAREIHDNVGHVLSRSVLQLGAIMAVTKNDENMQGLLSPLRESLDSAMDHIRKSVHDLRDDSIDLELSAREILSPLKSSYTVSEQYNFSDNIDVKIKLCFISVLKEAVTNIIRHSNADKIDVTMIEHPAFMQLVIYDNGTQSKAEDNEGMGLMNMRERVRILKGNINISRENGFRIFITVPKDVQEADSEDNNS